jgi:hypothetical protein
MAGLSLFGLNQGIHAVYGCLGLFDLVFSNISMIDRDLA